MDSSTFWTTIDTALSHCEGDSYDAFELVCEKLAKLPKADVAIFACYAGHFSQQAETWPLYQAYTLLMGVGTDDGFMDFRQSFVFLGSKRYNSALADPDSLADLPYRDIDFLCQEMLLNRFDDLLDGWDWGKTGWSPPPDVPVEEGVTEIRGKPYETWDQVVADFPRLTAKDP